MGNRGEIYSPFTLPKFNSSPLKSYLPNRKIVFQPSFFRGYVKLPGGKWSYGPLVLTHVGAHTLWLVELLLPFVLKYMQFITLPYYR